MRRVVIAAAGLLAVPFPTVAQEENPSGGADSGDVLGRPLTGYVSFRRRARWNANDADHDLYQTVALDWGNELEHPVTVHALARLSEDINGDRDNDGFFAFDSIQDTYDRSPVTSLYYAHVDVHRMGFLERGRVGRQFVEEAPTTLQFDGIRLDSEPLQRLRDLQLGTYGGLPVHPFESSSDGDSLVGAYAQAPLWKGARARLDVTRGEDETDEETLRNDLVGASIWQRLGSALRLHYQRMFLDREPRIQRARAVFQEPDWDLQVEVSAYQLMESEEILAIDFDSFVTILQDYAPYRQGGVTVSKGWGSHFTVDGGVQARELEHNSDEGFGNREFLRYFLTPAMHGLGSEGLTAAATVEAWNVREGDNGDFWTVGGDLTHQCTKALKASVGTAYALYKYDFLLGEERQQVRTVYARTSWAATPQTKVDVGWEYESSDYDGQDLGDFQTIKMGITYFLGKK